jgi:hypothetical protein
LLSDGHHFFHRASLSQILLMDQPRSTSRNVEITQLPLRNEPQTLDRLKSSLIDCRHHT